MKPPIVGPSIIFWRRPSKEQFVRGPRPSWTTNLDRATFLSWGRSGQVQLSGRQQWRTNLDGSTFLPWSRYSVAGTAQALVGQSIDLAPAITETATLKVATFSITETIAPALSETSSLHIEGLTASDSFAVAVDESLTLTIHLSTTASLAPAVTEDGFITKISAKTNTSLAASLTEVLTLIDNTVGAEAQGLTQALVETAEWDNPSRTNVTSALVEVGQHPPNAIIESAATAEVAEWPANEAIVSYACVEVVLYGRFARFLNRVH